MSTIECLPSSARATTNGGSIGTVIEFSFGKKYKKYKIMGRMVEKSGVIATDVELDKNASWGPKFVFTIKHMCDIVSVEPTELDTG